VTTVDLSMFRKAAALLLLTAMPVVAQFPRARTTYTGPEYWVGLSFGLLDGTTIYDGDTGGRWQIGYTSQIRATLEKTLQRDVAIGISAGYATAPLTYTAITPVGSCGIQCSADADVTQYMAFIHGGGGPGFHFIYTLEGGVTQFGNFRAKVDDSKLPPTDAKYDFSFGLGGGVGYGLSTTSDIYVSAIEDYVLHSQGTATSESAPRLGSVRAGFRIGF
jgi:hypothetical protein